MKIIYFTYNYNPSSRRGFDVSTSLFIKYLVNIYGADSINLVNLNNNQIDVKSMCLKELDLSFNVKEVFSNNNLYAKILNQFSNKSERGKLFSSQAIFDTIQEIIHTNTLNVKNTEIKMVFNSLVAMEFFIEIKEYFRLENINKIEYIYISENIKNNYYSSEDIKSDSLEKKKLLNIEKKLYDLDKVICFSKKDQDYYQSLNKKKLNCRLVFPLFYPKKTKNNPDWSQKIMLISNHLISDASIISLKWFLDKVYPFLDKEIKIIVTGMGDYSIFKNKYNGNINFVGFLDGDVLNNLFLKCALVFNSKMIGSGISINTLEAMSYDCVTVSTNYGNHFAPYVVSSDNGNKLAKIINDYIKFGAINNENLNYEMFFKTNFKRFQDYFEE